MPQNDSTNDIHDEKPLKAWLYRHGSHVSHWYSESSLAKCHARNALPHSVSHFFHPTRATFFGEHGDEGVMTQLWSSRAHRKHRYIYISSSQAARHKDGMWGRLALMRRIEYWNISWWVAQAFTWGSVVWVINGFAAFLPFCNSHIQKAPNAMGWTAFIGATIFEIGSIFGIWEVWNADFMAFESQANGGGFLANADKDLEGGAQNGDTQTADKMSGKAYTWTHTLTEKPKPRPKWVWFSTDPKYWHQLGWYAAFFQLLAASIFWISGFTAIPAMQDAIMTRTGVLDGTFWVPQIVGGTGFVISSTFIMLESQHVWYIPRPFSLGWHVGFWNFVGGVGFTLCAIFGLYTAHWGQYQSALSTFWGGWAFLIESVLQWYESVNSK